MAHYINAAAVLDARSITAGELLKSSAFRVPDYQRDFTWGPDEIEKLWEDVSRTRERAFPGGHAVPNPEPHFLGAIVTQKGAGGAPPEVIDGQQRLTTLSMLISVLYEYAGQIADLNTRTNVTMQLLPLIADTQASGRSPRLLLAREQEFFDQSVIQRLSMADREDYWATANMTKKPVRLRIRDAMRSINERITQDLRRAADPDERLGQIVDVLTEMLMMLHLNVADHRMAYRVFETLNFRGLELSQADLIKNELVRLGEKQNSRSEVVEGWQQVVKSLEKISQVNLVEFLQFHYASKWGPVRASDLFESVVDLLEEFALPAHAYTQDLVEESARLVQLVEGDAATWSGAVNDALEEMRDVLTVKFAYPLLMAAAGRYANSPSSFEPWALRVRDFCFRYFIIGRNPLSAFSSAVTDAARKLRDPRNCDDSVLEMLQDESPDKVFVDRFSKATVNTNKMGFYIIKRIEDHISDGAGKTFPQGPSQHLEHIMPKRPGGGWQHVSKDPLYESYLNRIGNLLGLERDINSHIKNKEYAYKAGNSRHLDYAHSDFQLPKETSTFLNGSSDWDFDSIVRRQNSLAELYASAVWPLK